MGFCCCGCMLYMTGPAWEGGEANEGGRPSKEPCEACDSCMASRFEGLLPVRAKMGRCGVSTMAVVMPECLVGG